MHIIRGNLCCILHPGCYALGMVLHMGTVSAGITGDASNGMTTTATERSLALGSLRPRRGVRVITCRGSSIAVGEKIASACIGPHSRYWDN